MNRTIMIVFLLGSILLASAAHAFDGQRRGFVLGAGLGFGSAKQVVEATGGDVSIEGSTSEGGLATDFRIGGGLNEQWLLYWTSQQVFFTAQAFGEDALFGQGLAGVGASYYLQPQAPSFFFEAALGIGSIIDFENDESDAGLGLLIGLGYEFAAHWQVGMSWSFTQIGDDQIGDIDVDTRIETFRFGVTWLGY
jgi:opacity protein-like surface antigen